MNELDLLTEALGRTDPAERAAYLDQACTGNPDLRRRLEEVLAGHARRGSRLDRPPFAPVEHQRDDATATLAHADPDATTAMESGVSTPRAAAIPTGEGIGTVIAGRYTLVEVIGEGGMGSVYLASQTEPVKRQVAIKLIKAGMDSRAVLARFDSERQALALMDHPHIAKVLDAGATDLGRPFFVMEHVKGIPLTDYCDQHRLGLPERLALFRQICSAVQHAHQKGIIHRDLKPTNILVESHDGKPVPKVIDFGLAKATGGLQLTEQSLYSGIGTVAGTPLYMAPEQATLNAIDIDTRADIYALGVILYELLTGSTPIQRETFRKAAIDEVLRIVRDVEPPVPSSRINNSETRASVAATRQTEPSRLGRFLRGDLDWIVMKALSKERQRRYETPIAFSLDIERFLNHEPVSAGPPTAAYRLRKFVRRNRGRVIAASLVLLALVGGFMGTTLGLVEAKRQGGIAVDERLRAERRLGQVEGFNEILGSIFKELNPRIAEKEGKKLQELLGERLDDATARIDGESIGDPLMVARMQMTLGESQLGLGYPAKAISLFAKALDTFTRMLGPDHPETLVSMSQLAAAYKEGGRLADAVELAERTFEVRKAKLGPDSVETLTSMNNLAQIYQAAGRTTDAVEFAERTFEARKAKLGLDSVETLTSMNNLAQTYQIAGRAAEATRLLEATLALVKPKLGPEHTLTLAVMNNLAQDYQAGGRLERAMPLLDEVLKLQTAKLGPKHPSTLTAMNNLALGYANAGRINEAVPLFEETLTLTKARLGVNHLETLQSMKNLAGVYRAAGRLDKSVPLFEETLSLQKAQLGPGHPQTLMSMNGLALAFQSAGKLDRALPLVEEALALHKTTFGPTHPQTLMCMANLAKICYSLDQVDRAVTLFEEVGTLTKSRLGVDHPDTLTVMNNLAVTYGAAGRRAEEIALHETTLKRREAKLGHDHPDLLQSRQNLGMAYEAVGRWADAEPMWRDKLARHRKTEPPDSPLVASDLAVLALNLQKQAKWQEAEAPLRECLDIRAKAIPDGWLRFNTIGQLGEALLGQARFAEAEPLVIQGYEQMKAREATIPAAGKTRLSEAAERVVRMYEAWGKPETAARWKATLGLADLPTDVFARP